MRPLKETLKKSLNNLLHSRALERRPLNRGTLDASPARRQEIIVRMAGSSSAFVASALTPGVSGLTGILAAALGEPHALRQAAKPPHGERAEPRTGREECERP